ncbi:glycosyltransferase [Morganella morganii]|uniref:glycosyltransferase n=1 Tax=Morganella morganii TaxID=582 RepID=UPI001E3B2CF7|nr:glycosyltransferase [Morganella morganii]UFH68565.1 glycosyltransferase [Morganella morganii]WNP30615.1 glycosyltransferase [Morganella morganii]
MKQHILFIIDGLPGGGAERVVLSLSHGLVLAGYDVTLLSLSNTRDYDIPEGVDYQVSADTYRGLFRRQTEIRRRAGKMDTFLSGLFARKGKPALVVSNLHKTDRIVAASQVLAGLNVWFCLHGMFSASYLGNKTGLRRRVKQAKIRSVYNGRNIIGVSGAVCRDLCENVGVTPQQCVTIYNPFDVADIQRQSLKDNPYQGQDYMVHLGRFHEVKRQDRLLTAFALANLPCKLLLAGQGSESFTQTLKSQVAELGLEDRVEFIGFQSKPMPIIRGAKAVVLSSDSEGLSSVLIESLICGTPVVSTRCPGGISEIMTGELTAYLSDLTPVSLAEKIRLVYEHPPEITPEMYHKFEQQTIVSQYCDLIQPVPSTHA